MENTEEKNVVTNKKYIGENQSSLHQVRLEKNYEKPIWGTFLQWKKLGRNIIKGEKGTTLFHPTQRKVEKKDGSTGFKS